ncbi:MAG: rhodanese-like domain-containing protein, partial [Alphaproteobacteria bacterium]|nr:rhodanese-like domain-containing protein [Alphaproteobacteria bacterium]
MNKTLTFILAMLGLNVGTACSQQDYENMDVSQFAELITNENVQLVDVRTAEEFAEGHIDGALNIDVKLNDFL